MKCCVPICKNDSRHVSKSQGITFHVFPKNSSVRKAWLKALGKQSWELKEQSAVCSEHFLSEDLYETKSGLCKIRVGAVPLIFQDSSSCDYGEPASLKACRICLVMDVKLVTIRVYKLLEQAYENLTGISLSEEDKLPQKLCMECVQRLLNYSRFRDKSLRANSLMLEVIKKQDCLTAQNIKTINRLNNQLTSSLSTKHFEVNHFDSYFEYEDEPILKQDNSSPSHIVDSDDETIILLALDITDKNDDELNEPGVNDLGINDPGVNDPGFCDNGIADTDVSNDKDDIWEEEYLLPSDNDNYSSDDSLSSEECKVKKTRKRKEEVDKPVKTAKRVKKIKDPTEPKIDRRKKFPDELNETLFTITDLTVEEQIAEIVKRQESANYKNSFFKCTVCFKGFLDDDTYNSHMSRHTNQCGEHICEICKTHFKRYNDLRKHITGQHVQRFSCNRCPYVSTHRQMAKLHERWHRGTKYKCPHCQDEFAIFSTYMGHIRIKHPSDFVCELCGNSFVSVKGIALHKKFKHRLDNLQIPEDGPLCELCNVRFASSEALKRHITVSTKHDTDKDSESNKPKRGRKSKEELERMEREKDGDSDRKRRIIYPRRKVMGPIPCEQCGIQLEDARAYHYHFRQIHPDKNRTNYPSIRAPCMCEVCGRIFRSYGHLKEHTFVHTGARPFKCDSCGKSFRMKQRLALHRELHREVRTSYECGLCEKQFSCDSNRRRHMVIHTGLKPFKCEVCGKAFKSKPEKRAHINYVHLKKPLPKRARGKRRSDTRKGQLVSEDEDKDIEATL